MIILIAAIAFLIAIFAGMLLWNLIGNGLDRIDREQISKQTRINSARMAERHYVRPIGGK